MCLKSTWECFQTWFSFSGQMVFWKKIFKIVFQYISMWKKNITPFVAPSNKYESTLSKDAFTQVLSILAKWVSEKKIFKRFSNYFHMKTIPLIAALPYSLWSWFEQSWFYTSCFLHKRFSYSGHTGFEKSFKNISLFIPE